ncbi:MAG: hypothetical protein GKR89_12985 [Candidatus Latescibacteria bacterium]|nr:hypothetical protein [Candidatus Latescibacterota bacterium]
MPNRSAVAIPRFYPQLCALLIAGSLLLPTLAAALICGQGHLPDQAAKATGPDQAPTRITPFSSVKALVIFARFQDENSGNTSAPAFSEQIFDPDIPGSMSHFYREMSRGQFEITGTVLPRWYTSPGPAVDYVAEPGKRGNYGLFANRILQAVDADIDLGLYDDDGPDGLPNSGDDDGFVDFIFINTLTTPQNFIVGGATGIANLGLGTSYVSGDPAVNGGFIRVRSNQENIAGGTLQRGHTFALAVGSMAHELGHILGLPDLFDTEFIQDRGTNPNPAEDSAGIGYWGLMAHGTRGWNEIDGPNPFCAWSLAQLGWLGTNNTKLLTLEEDLPDAVFEDVNAGGLVYRIPTTLPKQYFLVERRTPGNSFYERNLPGDGLLIWQIDDNRSSNNDESFKLVDLVSADGRYQDAGFPLGTEPAPYTGRDNLDFWAHDGGYTAAFGGNLGDATDLFDGRTATDFSVISNPAANTGISVGNIRRQGGLMRASLRRFDPRRAGPVPPQTTWQDTIEIVGDVTVEAGSVLIVAPGTVVRFGPDLTGRGLDPLRTELIVAGQLLSGITNRTPVHFTSAQANPRPGDWLGIRLTAFGQLDIDGALIEYAQSGISADEVRRTQRLQEMTISQTAAEGIHLENISEEVILSGVEITRSGGHGAFLEGRGHARIYGGRFADNAGTGLEANTSLVECLDTEFIDNGLNREEAAGLVLGQRIRGRVSRNQFSGGAGLHGRETGVVQVSENIFTDNTVALRATSARMHITDNTFRNSQLVFQISGLALPPVLNLNRIEDAQRLVENTSSIELGATNNWWGSPDGAGIEARIEGLVQWRPFLNFDPIFPTRFALQKNYPNPFNASTVIDYSIGINTPIVAGASEQILEIRTVTGTLVRRLVRQAAAPGFYSAVWDGRNDQGEAVASGVYYYQLTVGPFVDLKRLLFLK